jgi:hypothetical protein
MLAEFTLNFVTVNPHESAAFTAGTTGKLQFFLIGHLYAFGSKLCQSTTFPYFAAITRVIKNNGTPNQIFLINQRSVTPRPSSPCS